MRGNGTGGFYSDSHACVDCANRNMHHFKDLEPWPASRSTDTTGDPLQYGHGSIGKACNNPSTMNAAAASVVPG